MPFYLRDLGFSSLVLVLLLFFSPILAFVVRRKWRMAAARKEEIMRLVILASEEATRAELEAAVEYGDVVATTRQMCAVCYSPTTTRCSRCKAVRYCSGKCQIIHWRQGHKEECFPPPTTAQFDDTGNDSDFTSVLHAKQSEFPEKPTTSESSCSSTLLGGKDDGKVGPLVDVMGADSSIVSLSAIGCSTSTTPADLLVSDSVNESPLSSSTSTTVSGGPLSDDINHDTPRSTADGVPCQNKSQISEYTSLAACVNTFSCSSKLKQKTPGSSTETVDCESSCNSSPGFMSSDECLVVSPSPLEFPNATLESGGAQCIDHDDSSQSSFREGDDSVQPYSGFRFSFNLSRQSVLSTCSNPKIFISDNSHNSILGNGMPRASPLEKLVNESQPALGSDRSSSIAKERNDNERLPKSHGPMPLSFGTSTDCISSGSKRFTSTITSSKVDSARTVPTCERENSTPNGSNSLKTSMRKVVQQFRPSILSKHHPLGFGSEIAGKYNYKMLFPYDLFIKLYSWDKVELRPCGLTNCGNSCYANAVLQCLAFTRPLTAYLLQGYHAKSCPKKEWCFTCELESLVLKAREGKSPISPIRILSQIQSIGSHLGHGREEDAHEFLRYAIDTMQSMCLKEAGVNAEAPLAEETTLMQLIFGGYLRSKIKCMKCQGKSERHERMMDLTVEIHGGIGTLEEALARFTATEILDGDNKYQCGRCKSYEKAKKKLTVTEAPNILTIALKRFQSGKFGKLNKSVRFPEILDLAKYMSGAGDKSHVYKLYAVVVHLDIMNAAFSGHYVCYVKNIQGKWFKIDDSTVTPVELDRVLSKTAYMLLYARCSPRAPSVIRNAMSYDHLKNKRSNSMEAIPRRSCSERSISKGRSRPSDSSFTGSSVAVLHRPEDYPYWMARDRPAHYEFSDSLDGSFFPMYRIPKSDSSSDSCSLLSCSDEGSCSTESTTDSTSTDDYSEYIFGDSGSFRVLEDSEVSYSPSFSGSSPVFTSMHVSTSPERHQVRGEIPLGKESHPFLFSNTAKQSRKLTDHRSSSSSSISSSDADWELLGWVNPSDPKSGGVSLRRPWEKVTQTFY